MYQWLLAALGLLLPAARRSAPSDNPDEPPAKKTRADYAIVERDKKVGKGVAAKDLPSKARSEGRKAPVSNAAPTAESAAEDQSVYYEPPAKKRRVSGIGILESDKMPYGTSTCLNKETLTLYHKPVSRLSANGNGTAHVKLAPRPPIKEHAVPTSAASEVSKMGRLFCTAEEGVKQEEREKYKQLLNLMKEKNPSNQVYGKQPVPIASLVEERKLEGTLYPSVPQKAGGEDGDACSSQVPLRADMTREKNTKEQGKPGKLDVAAKQNGASGDGSSVPPRPLFVFGVDAKIHSSLGRTAPEIPPITEDMEREINAVFDNGEPNDIVSSAFKINITRDDIRTLQKYNWLNDQIINFYMYLVMERSKKEKYPVVYAFTTFFYRKLISGGYAAVERWTKGVDIFRQDIVLVPVYQKSHWTLAVIDMRQKSIRYFDSVALRGSKICDIVFNYLQEEAQAKRQLKLIRSEWTLHNMTSHEIPQQWNVSDCGVFVCKYADYIARDKPLSFTQNNMPYFRKKMVWEIIHQQLL
ncbi:sentrin-specific protease 2 [Cuculus canorus]|uniref:sentrin-specific protease 2 n=1 Tax=Cuculus canorus TaxID=55661 RepID=UPI0023AB1236|nr:sentrin-specific protease 2 [Cuculus canorus]